MGGKRALLLAMVTLGPAACFGPSPEATASLAQVREDGRALDRTLDEVENRLIGGQALLQRWEELSRRHREVTAISCGNAVAHTAQMVALQERQRQRQLQRRGRLLAREGGVGGPAP